MEMLNYYGLIIMLVIMIPNMIYAIKHKDSIQYKNKKLEMLEQIGRYGSMISMVINIPFLTYGFWFKESLQVYLISNSILCLLYCSFWIIYWNNNNILKSLLLSFIPSLIFIVSGILTGNLFLLISSLLFAPTHITISYKTELLLSIR